MNIQILFPSIILVSLGISFLLDIFGIKFPVVRLAVAFSLILLGIGIFIDGQGVQIMRSHLSHFKTR